MAVIVVLVVLTLLAVVGGLVVLSQWLAKKRKNHRDAHPAPSDVGHHEGV